ncbi:MAG: hypothetical protein H6739_09370 [Alphaproteobacteria bacterium]|nr:hypothetical protein [Alphaproteobacteria bacterium]
MERDTFRQALLATARVACAVALVGCVPKTGEPVDSTPTEQTDDTSVTTDDTSATADDTSSTTDDTSASTDDTSSTTDDSGNTTDDSADPLAECQQEVNAVFGQNGSQQPTPATAECCQTIAEYYDAQSLSGLEQWAERDDCCSLLNWQGSLACTPWGPPCPPAMPAKAMKAVA